MTKDEIRLLYEYDRWANRRVLQAASSLSPEQFTRDLGGSFRSVQDTLLHIISGEWGWLTFWKEPSPDSAFVKNLWDRMDALFPADSFPDVATVMAKWTEVEQEQIAFVNGLTDETLKKMLPIQSRSIQAALGTQLSLLHLMQHLANHSTYHRGQVALMLRQLGAKPLATDFHVFLMEGRVC